MKKMSKFDVNLKNVIFLFDLLVIIRKKIKSVVIDFSGIIEYNKEEKLGVFNLLIIYFVIIGEIIFIIEEKYVGKGYGDFKIDLVELVVVEFELI